MKKLSALLLVLSALLLSVPAFALDQSLYNNAVSIEDATANKTRCQAIYVGVAGSYDFSVKDSTGAYAWLLFSNVAAGAILPIRANGARDADDTAPEAGDIIFLY